MTHESNPQREAATEGFLDSLYLDGLRGKTRSTDVDPKLFAFMILMFTHRDLFLKTFPARGGVDMKTVVEQRWFKEGDIPKTQLEILATHRDALVLTIGAWKDFAGYEDPPCPDEGRLRRLVEFLTSGFSR
jgi:hypothetical protein